MKVQLRFPAVVLLVVLPVSSLRLLPSLANTFTAMADSSVMIVKLGVSSLVSPPGAFDPVVRTTFPSLGATLSMTAVIVALGPLVSI